jgi:hypothetical protein
MGLINKKADNKSNVQAPADGAPLKGGAKFEADPGEGAAGKPAAEAEVKPQVQTAAETPAASTGTAVAERASGAIAPTSLKMVDFVMACKDRYKVDWNTLDRVQANNGSFLDLGDNKKTMGDTIQLRLLSWQDSYQISPGSDAEEAKQYVRYSHDGVTTTQGENIAEYVQRLKANGYPAAKCDHRVVICGELVGSSKDSRLVGSLVQLDLSATSKQEFDKYQINTAFKLGRGLVTQDAVELMTMKAEVASGKNNRSWTIVKFEPTILN